MNFRYIFPAKIVNNKMKQENLRFFLQILFLAHQETAGMEVFLCRFSLQSGKKVVGFFSN